MEPSAILVYVDKGGPSAYRSTRAGLVVEASLSAVMALMMDIPNFTSWMDSRLLAEPLTVLDRFSGYGYMERFTSWSVRHRAAVFFFQVTQDPESRISAVVISNAAAYLPEKPGLVRVPAFASSWQVEPLVTGQVRIVNFLCFEPGGVLAPFLGQCLRGSIRLADTAQFRDSVTPATLSRR